MKAQATRMSLQKLFEAKVSSSVQACRWLSEAEEVVVFGSTSLGMNRTDSDLDILFVGPEANRSKRDGLDLISVTQETRDSKEWLTGELASHIATYGIWIVGQDSWKSMAMIGSQAVQYKKDRVRKYLTSLPSVWGRLQPSFREKYLIKVRRETQRLLLLEKQLAIPPTLVIDDHWTANGGTYEEVLERIVHFGIDKKNSFTDALYGSIRASEKRARLRRSS